MYISMRLSIIIKIDALIVKIFCSSMLLTLLQSRQIMNILFNHDFSDINLASYGITFIITSR